jgi:3-methyladenine DNA glycosylase AlkD
MDTRTALALLQEAGTEQNRKIFRRHGAGEDLYGVSFKDLRAIAKRAAHDQALARSLWWTGNVDARLLACLVAEPALMDEEDLDVWLAEISYYPLVDIFVANVAAEPPGLRARMERWTRSARDWTAQAGWDLVGILATREPDLPDRFFVDLLSKIEREIQQSGNRTRHAMNGALIAIGLRNEYLREAAVEFAVRIGPVVVDHGQTGCVTPAAIPYIERTLARREAQAVKRAEQAAAKAAKTEPKSSAKPPGKQAGKPSTKAGPGTPRKTPRSAVGAR